jgi:phospholipid/cholesterol/gamma-HCH transport system ATP-binding protein
VQFNANLENGKNAMAQSEMNPADAFAVEVRNLRLCHESNVLIDDISFQIQRGEIFAIVGGSGCGKSTLLRHLIGLREAKCGKVFLNGYDVNSQAPEERVTALNQLGVLFQGGALWTSMNLHENVALPLEGESHLSPQEISDIADFKLDLVAMGKFSHFFPHKLSGGMVKRVGVARAMARNPSLLFLDEPSAGLDPIASKDLDSLVLEMRKSYGITIIMVTHELRSIFSVVDRVAYLDGASHSLLEIGNPHALAKHSPHEKIRKFLDG